MSNKYTFSEDRKRSLFMGFRVDKTDDSGSLQCLCRCEREDFAQRIVEALDYLDSKPVNTVEASVSDEKQAEKPLSYNEIMGRIDQALALCATILDKPAPDAPSIKVVL